jgi:YVTN family beta-propeller protein
VPAAASAAPIRRRLPVVLTGVGGALLVAAAIAAVLVLRGGGGGGLSVVHPNSVGVIDPASNEVVAEVPVGIRPGPIAAAPGSVWIGNLTDRTLTRVDTRTRTNAGTISLDNQTPTGVAVGEGAVWVAHGLLGKLSRIDPTFGRVTQTLRVAAASNDGQVTVGGGFVWSVYGDSTLGRVDPASVRLEGRGLTGAGPSGIVYANDAVWVSNRDDQNVSRFNPATFQEGALRAISVGEGPAAIAVGDGAIWVANSGDDTVTRIDAGSYSTFTIEVGQRPTAIAFGADAVWVANSSGTISRIDPALRKVVETIDVGNRPAGIATGDGFVWVSVQAP